MKRLLFSFAFFASLCTVHSQEPYKYLGNYTQPAPNAAALGKYVDYPVSYYTGTPNISIPLFDLQDGAARTGISLSYHSSGIRVAELASWVGLGWALNAAGVITRTVRGGPDDGVYTPMAACGGYYKDSGIRKMPLLPYPTNGVIQESGTATNTRNEFMIQVGAGNADTEPDIFTFNFNGYGGKFVFDERRIPRLLTDADVRIEVNFNVFFQSWIITTPDGAKYFFGENNVREYNKVYSNSSGIDNNSQKPASWLLTRIVYPNTKDTIYFDYVAENYSYFDLGQETKIYNANQGDGDMVNACALSVSRPSNVYKTTVDGFRLTAIRSRNYRIAFGVNTAAGARQDLVNSGSNLPYRLDSVKIYNSQNQCLKQYLLSYAYFTSSTANNVWSPINSFTLNDATDRYRLKLTAVREYAGDGLTSKPPYAITYEETYQLPRRLSYDIDHWGYSNNYSGNVNDRFTPATFHSICNTSSYGYGAGANRKPKWPDMQQYAIKTIKDPLGVITAFEFESHTSTLMSPSQTVGGLRIKKITTTDGLTGIVNTRSYNYGSGGILSRVPEYLIFPNNEFYYDQGSVTKNPVSYRGYAFQNGMILVCGIKQSQSVVPLQDFQGNHIGYPIVKEVFGNAAEGGYKIYNFMADQMTYGNSRLDMSNYTAVANISTQWYGNSSGIYGNGQFNNIPPQNLVYYNSFNVQNYYPAAPTQVDFRRGQLLSEETYDSTNQLIRNVRNNYVQLYHEDTLIRGFKIFRTTSLVGNQSGSGLLDADAMTFYKLRTGISHLASTTTTDYKDGKSFSSVTSYKYESPYHTQKTSDSTVNSTGDIIISKSYYSFDYANGATADNVFGKMKARNMLLPVATRVWKNNQLLSGTVTLYKDFATAAPDTFINPSKIYALETGTPLTTVQAGENVAFTTAFTTLLPNAYFKEKASFNVSGTTGKITEQKLVSDKNQALIWDNKLNMPLAQTDNATFADVAYNSFESAETGNWTYATGSVNTDATAPTGGKAYTVSGGISKSGLTSTKKYILSYWLKSGGSVTITGGTQSNSITGRVKGSWTYKQVSITGTTSISLSGSGSIDEVRLHPADAQMTSYTYDSLFRLVAQNSPNNSISYYEYDGMNRLVAMKDQYGNVIKAFEYNYGVLSR